MFHLTQFCISVRYSRWLPLPLHCDIAAMSKESALLAGVLIMTSCVSKWGKKGPVSRAGKNTPVPPQKGSRLWNGTANKTCIHPHPAPDLLFCVRRAPAQRQAPHRDTWQRPSAGQRAGKTRPPFLICFLLSFREYKDQMKMSQVAQSIAIVYCTTDVC